jgi:hypothetical protein
MGQAYYTAVHASLFKDSYITIGIERSNDLDVVNKNWPKKNMAYSKLSLLVFDARNGRAIPSVDYLSASVAPLLKKRIKRDKYGDCFSPKQLNTAVKAMLTSVTTGWEASPGMILQKTGILFHFEVPLDENGMNNNVCPYASVEDLIEMDDGRYFFCNYSDLYPFLGKRIKSFLRPVGGKLTLSQY